jgi:proteasome lid subunit RPN8/RPN11
MRLEAIKPAGEAARSRVSSPVAYEYKVKLQVLRECPLPPDLEVCDRPDLAAAYWRENVQGHPYFDPAKECLVVLLLDTRRHVRGHQLVSIGTRDTLLVTIGDMFRSAVVMAAATVIVMHNHPSGDPEPSDGDIRVTENLVSAGRLLNIQVMDHVIVGSANDGRPIRYCSMFASRCLRPACFQESPIAVYRKRTDDAQDCTVKRAGVLIPPQFPSHKWCAVAFTKKPSRVAWFHRTWAARRWFNRHFGSVLFDPHLSSARTDATGEYFIAVPSEL